jgi:hypothetical protein
MTTRIGDKIRPCWGAARFDLNLGSVPKVKARLGNVFTVDAVSAQPLPNGAVRIKGEVWVRSWVRIS